MFVFCFKMFSDWESDIDYFQQKKNIQMFFLKQHSSSNKQNIPLWPYKCIQTIIPHLVS